MFLDEALQRDLPGFVKGRRHADPIARISPNATPRPATIHRSRHRYVSVDPERSVNGSSRLIYRKADREPSDIVGLWKVQSNRMASRSSER